MTDVSRGDIHLTDGPQKARVLGEGLPSSKPEDPTFVVYLNSINEIESNGQTAAVSEAVRQEIIDAIKRYFSGRRMNVDFE
ncbi:Imm74 family immunity protein [Paraburkholderia bannensis]|uniref:Imm74 family immunity protein n=1 Tax=Paraburkholderia bannensis TaxID=765414 RepID=UPI002ABE360B|nr:Imm74 family immunity protein [Paraburkholderia bannensis]